MATAEHFDRSGQLDPWVHASLQLAMKLEGDPKFVAERTDILRRSREIPTEALTYEEFCERYPLSDFTP